MKTMIAVLTLQLAATALGIEKKLHEYSFRYPMTVQTTCLTAAKEYADALARATGVAVQRYTCALDYDYFKITVSYLAAEALYVVPERDRYPTYQACTADLARRKERYVRFTKIEPFFAFCALPFRYHSPFGYTDTSANLFIDGFGEAALRPRQEEVRYRGRLLESESLIARELSSRLEALGFPISLVGFHGTEPYEGTLNLTYYGERHLTTSAFGYLSMRSCWERIDDLRAFSADAPAFVGAFCTWSQEAWPQAQLNALWDTTTIWGFGSEKLAGEYRDFTSCHADRARVLALYKTIGKNPVGAICAANLFRTTFSMEVFTRTGIDR